MHKILNCIKSFLSIFVFVKSVFKKENIQTASEKAEEASLSFNQLAEALNHKK